MKIVEYVLSTNRLSAREPSEHVMRLLALYENGLITSEGLLAEVKEKYSSNGKQ
ncbi:antitoxin VbhA family protein [Pseudomonas nitroreducens]|uniref:antitoxin VbhA family protein n=1 Tax=Pseudomonas nitroreducens TaxID=46680 RepID=UPI0012FD3A1A|nr:antitoxin VbhA family protein [Pseudomonas nitroreducens]